MEAISGENRWKGEMQPDMMPDENRLPGKAQPETMPYEKQLPDAKQPDTVPDSARLAARLREETAELLALLPAARKAAAGGPAGGEAALDGMARAAYRVLRIAENMDARAALAAGTEKPAPICVTALAAAYVNGAAGVCRSAVFQPEWPREPLWSPGCARLFAAALGNLLANAVQYGGERPFVSVRARKSGMMVLLSVADNGAGYAVPYETGETGDGLGIAVARQYAETFGGQLLVNNTPGLGARFTLCLPLCAPGKGNLPGARETQSMPGAANLSGARETQFLPGTATSPDARGTPSIPGTDELPRAQEMPDARQTPFAPPIPPDYMADRFSPLYVQLAPVCDLPL
ncbi:MAG: ATP-binding protein [Subdoligranulum sp.]|nr:ATP-binding protein [Subdoligranulum sp.]